MPLKNVVNLHDAPIPLLIVSIFRSGVCTGFTGGAIVLMMRRIVDGVPVYFGPVEWLRVSASHVVPTLGASMFTVLPLLLARRWLTPLGTVLAGAIVGMALVLIQFVLISAGFRTTILSPRYVAYLIGSSVLVAITMYVTTVVFVILGDTK